MASRLAIHHNGAMTDDEILEEVEALQFDAGPVTAERRNRGFTLIYVATGTLIARLRPVKGHDGLFDILYFIGGCGRSAGSTSAPLAAWPPRSTRRSASLPKPRFSGSPSKTKIKNAQSRAKEFDAYGPF